MFRHAHPWRLANKLLRHGRHKCFFYVVSLRVLFHPYHPIYPRVHDEGNIPNTDLYQHTTYKLTLLQLLFLWLQLCQHSVFLFCGEETTSLSVSQYRPQFRAVVVGAYLLSHYAFPLVIRFTSSADRNTKADWISRLPPASTATMSIASGGIESSLARAARARSIAISSWLKSES